MELNRATKAYGAYVNNCFVGVLLADMKGETKPYHRFYRTIFVKAIDVLQSLVAGKGVGALQRTLKNRQSLRAVIQSLRKRKSKKWRMIMKP